jgi:hypothetical protein
VLGTPAFRMRPSLPLACALAAAAAFAVACDDRTKTRRVQEAYTVVPGTPSVDSKTPQVLYDDGGDTTHFAINVPRQCDVFRQVSVRKVDILWVIDNSGSMAPKQNRLAQQFKAFTDQLVAANPPIDFHIAVITTDTDDPLARGELRTWTLGGTTRNYISCVPQMTGGVKCNTDVPGVDAGTASAVAAFDQLGRVGINGSAQERGLYAAYLALTNPLNITGATEKFVRPDAALYVVFVSDEDDSSCQPLTRQPVCTADPGCRCANDNALSGAGNWGATSYFTRFFETYKGYNNADLVTVAAIVAVDDDPDSGVPSQFLDTVPHIGCCRTDAGTPCTAKTGTNAAVPGSGVEVAYFGGRYLQVANDTGGVGVDICQTDFSSALSALGYAASGLRKEFRLTRGPDVHPMGTLAGGMDIFVSAPNAPNCMVDGNCPMGDVCRSQRCAKKVDAHLIPFVNGAEYVKCESLVPRNIVRFDGTAVPDSLATVEICYDVKPDFQSTCP